MVIGMSFHSLIVKDLFVIILESTRFTWRMKLLSGRRGVAILYAYMLLGLGFLRAVSPDFGDLANQEQELEGTFRLVANISLALCNFQVLIIRRTSEY
jgi:hypothetical protein